MREKIDTQLGVKTTIQNESEVRNSLATAFSDFLSCLDAAIREMDVLHIDDPGRRESILKEVIRIRANSTSYSEAVVRLDVAAAHALGDLEAVVRETFKRREPWLCPSRG